MDFDREGIPDERYTEPDTDLAQLVSTSLPTAKGAPAQAPGTVLVPSLDRALQDPALPGKLATALARIPSMKLDPSASSEEQIEQAVVQMVDNLLFLHDAMPEGARDRARQWYDGSRAMVDSWVERYAGRYTDSQIAAALAVMSPKMDWYANVSLSERIIDIWDTRQDHRWDDKMDQAAADTVGVQSPARKPVLERVRGKKLGELTDPLEQAIWVVIYNQAHNPSSFRMIRPEGGFLDFVRTGKGAPTKLAWGNGFGPVAKALSVLQDGSPGKISEQLGSAHKVRNFNNNIFDPNSPLGFATIDTHAIAAAVMMPYGASAGPVNDGFGATAESSILGIYGTYPVYWEAYKRAAEERGLLPREMQSIAWEALRALLPPSTRTAYSKAPGAVDQLWERYANGTVTQQEARQAFVARYIGDKPFPIPDWGTDGRGGGVTAATSYESGLPSGRRVGGTFGRRAGVDTPGISSTLESELGQGPVRGPSAITLTGVHFSQKARTELDGKQYGTGLKGLERERLVQSQDQRLAIRVYFYIDEGKGITPEGGVGGYAHEAVLPNMYDAKADPDGLWFGDANASESRILDAGYDGYYSPGVFGTQGAAVLLGDAALNVSSQP